MPIITETLRGDELFCLQEFMASPQGEPFSNDTCHRFRIGERIHFVNWFHDDKIIDNPVGWLVVLEAEDGKNYAAPQTYFATKECWQGLQKHFLASQRKSAPAGKKKKTSSAILTKKKKTGKK